MHHRPWLVCLETSASLPLASVSLATCRDCGEISEVCPGWGVTQQTIDREGQNGNVNCKPNQAQETQKASCKHELLLTQKPSEVYPAKAKWDGTISAFTGLPMERLLPWELCVPCGLARLETCTVTAFALMKFRGHRHALEQSWQGTNNALLISRRCLFGSVCEWGIHPNGHGHVYRENEG